ncbi:LPS export ABC transporter permease LptG [Uliginosibacterium sp. H3]|uniref:LPS export ABC transporter permease LptG n=1 Tax=Uliginosibacterium silvisoli TaxID=3114758 RepID=A0ABU6K3D7_9RHOO|nr:LPS export ABC transporter permease LptG [Uliginosibacterium sp. H3]
MKTLSRHLRKEVVGATLLVLLAFIALFAFFDFLGELDQVGQGGYKLKHALIFVALTIPSRAYEIMPIAVLIGALYALTQLARHSELTVMRAAGVSTLRMLGSLLRVGLIFVVVTFALGEYIAPPLERVAQKWRLRSTNASAPQELRTGVWLRDGNRFINVGKAQPDAALENIKVYELDDAYHVRSISFAERGEYAGDGNWLVSNVVQTRLLGDRTEVESFAQMPVRSSLTPNMFSVGMVTPERMAIGSLYQYVQHLQENRQRTGRYEVAYWKKLIYPFAALVMIGLALPFCLGSQRAGNVSARVMLGVMLGMGFYLLNGLSSNLGVINGWPALPTAAAPSLLFLALAIFMLRAVERR